MCAVKMCPFEINNLACAISTGINTAIDADLQLKEIVPESCCLHCLTENPWHCVRRYPLCRYEGVEDRSISTPHLTISRRTGRTPV